VLYGAIEELERHPASAIVVFEAPFASVTGKAFRRADFRIEGAGATWTKFEVKEIGNVRQLRQRREQEQFADYIWDDFQVLSGIPVQPGGSLPYFKTFRFRIKYAEIAERALARLRRDGVQALTGLGDPRVRAQVLDDIRKALRPALDLPALTEALHPEVLDGYRQAFERLEFVELF
jgi:hypothetical protein